VATYLQREGFATLAAYDGEEALAFARTRSPGFIILDIMLPGIDGWEICRQVRKFSEVPILMLTAREEEIDRVLGLTLGADDYVVKPFSPRELVERVKAILRRVRAEPRSGRSMVHGALTLDSEKHKVSVAGVAVNLTSSEFKLLETLMSSPGRVFARNELLDRLNEHGETVIDRVVDVHIGRLRQKIEDNPARPRLILTVRGFGYRFAEADEA
jgi:DNA-binding response OmpR family regulator